MERKSVIGQLVSTNSIARSELLKLFGLDYEDQLRKKNDEDRVAKELQEEEAEKDQVRNANKANIFGQNPAQQTDYSTNSSTPQDVQAKAQEIAGTLKPLDGAGRRTELQKIKSQNETLYYAVKGVLEQMTKADASSGVQAGKQQAQGQ